MASQKYFVLQNGTYLDTPPADANTFYIAGIRENNLFKPETLVLGKGNMSKAGTPGWYEINARQFYAMQTAKAPVSPYVKGYMTESGFSPSSREVY